MLFAKAFSHERPWAFAILLDIKLARFRRGIAFSQRKYVLDMLSEAGMLGCRATDAPKLILSC